MQEGKNWILPKEMNAYRFFWDSHWLEIWSNHFCPSTGPNGGSVERGYGLRANRFLHSRSCVVKTIFGHIPPIEQSKKDVFIKVIFIKVTFFQFSMILLKSFVQRQLYIGVNSSFYMYICLAQCVELGKN